MNTAVIRTAHAVNGSKMTTEITPEKTSMFLLVDKGNESQYWPKTPCVMFGEWPDVDRLRALVEDWKIVRGDRFQVQMSFNGRHMRVRVL